MLVLLVLEQKSKMVVRGSPTTGLHGTMVSKSNFCIPPSELLNPCGAEVRIHILNKLEVYYLSSVDICELVLEVVLEPQAASGSPGDGWAPFRETLILCGWGRAQAGPESLPFF